MSIKPTTAEGWAALLRQGDGGALIPLEGATMLYEAGMLRQTIPPVPHRYVPTHCYVKLRP